LMAKADKLWAKNSHQHGPFRCHGWGWWDHRRLWDSGGDRFNNNRGWRQWFRRSPCPLALPQLLRGAGYETPSRLVLSSTGLCYYHWTFGKQAHQCKTLWATAPYFYGSILLRALKSEIIVLLTYVYKK
jgi:hypothetical protein